MDSSTDPPMQGKAIGPAGKHPANAAEGTSKNADRIKRRRIKPPKAEGSLLKRRG